MPPVWKSIIVSLVIYVAILTGCFLKMAGYLQSLYFNEPGLTHTVPGASVAFVLGITAIVLVVINIAIAKMLTPKEKA